MTTVLITGAGGFIGGHMARHVVRQGARTVGLGHGLTSDGIPLAEWLNGEISEANLRQLAERSGPPDVVIHLAGGSSVGASLSAPLEDFRRTVDASTQLLDCAR